MLDPDGFRVELIESARAFSSYRPEQRAGATE
jgi:hypothetical protein